MPSKLTKVLLAALIVTAVLVALSVRADASPEANGPWHRVAVCESTDTPAIDTGNGFYGLVQFTQRTWDWIAGRVDPSWVGIRANLAPREVQLTMADDLAFNAPNGGLGHWPVCGLLYDHSQPRYTATGIPGPVTAPPAITPPPHTHPVLPAAKAKHEYSRPTQVILMRYNHDPLDPFRWTQ